MTLYKKKNVLEKALQAWAKSKQTNNKTETLQDLIRTSDPNFLQAGARQWKHPSHLEKLFSEEVKVSNWINK